MASYSLKSTIVGSTGATGANGFTGLIAAQNTAVATAITTAQGVTGYIANSLNVTQGVLINDTGSGFLEMIQTLTYSTYS